MVLPVLVVTSLRQSDPFQFCSGSLPSDVPLHFVFLDEPLDFEILGRTVRLSQGGTYVECTSDNLAGALFLPASFDKLLSKWDESAPNDELSRRLHWNTLICLFVCLRELRCLNEPLSAIAAANKLSLHLLLPDYTFPSVYSVVREMIASSLSSPYLFKSANDTSEIDEDTRISPQVFERIPDVTDERPVGIWQEFVASEKEFRCYYFCGDVISFEMPRGDLGHPVARYVSSERYEVKEVCDGAVADLVRRVCSKCNLEFAALDLLRVRGVDYVIDVNPHGSWNWLPAIAAEQVRGRFRSMISKFFQCASRE
jgi:hypothetical protein